MCEGVGRRKGRITARIFFSLLANAWLDAIKRAIWSGDGAQHREYPRSHGMRLGILLNTITDHVSAAWKILVETLK